MNKDFFGIVIEIGDYVVFDCFGLVVAEVIRFTPKMVEVERQPGSAISAITHVYANETIRLEGEQVVIYKLKNSC